MGVFDERALRAQFTLCHERGARPMPLYRGTTVAVSGDVGAGKRPVHGLRLHPRERATGWHFWTGTWMADPDFFAPLETESIAHACPLVLPMLALPPGWRLLAYGTYFDVWYDSAVDRGGAPVEI